MIPSAKIAKRCREPPEKVFSRPRTLLPATLFLPISSTASMLIPGAGMYEPSRYSASIAAVNSSFLRMSLTLKALTKVLSIEL